MTTCWPRWDIWVAAWWPIGELTTIWWQLRDHLVATWRPLGRWLHSDHFGISLGSLGDHFVIILWNAYTYWTQKYIVQAIMVILRQLYNLQPNEFFNLVRNEGSIPNLFSMFWDVSQNNWCSSQTYAKSSCSTIGIITWYVELHSALHCFRGVCAKSLWDTFHHYCFAGSWGIQLIVIILPRLEPRPCQWQIFCKGGVAVPVQLSEGMSVPNMVSHVIAVNP